MSKTDPNTGAQDTTLPDRLRAFRGLDLNLFVVFALIYERRSLTAAGLALGLTQPAVSHALARLRKSLGDRLFVRQGSVVVPTTFAKSIIDDVLFALDTLRAGPLGEQRFDPATSVARFNIAMTAGMEIYLLPLLLKRLSVEAPNVVIRTTRVERGDVESQLARGELSFAIETDPPRSTHTRQRLLASDQLLTLSRKGNVLIAKGLDKATYLSAHHIAVSTRSDGGCIEDYELAKLGQRRHVVARCNTATAALRSIAETDLLLTLGYRQLITLEPNHDMALFDFPFDTLGLDGILYWHEDAESEPSSLWMRSLLVDAFDQIKPRQ